MKTIKELNIEAGEWVAYYFLKNSEYLLGSFRTPLPLSDWTETYAMQWVPESIWQANPRFHFRRQWPKIREIALAHAKAVLLHLGTERYPLTYAHFTQGKVQREIIRGGAAIADEAEETRFAEYEEIRAAQRRSLTT